MLTCKEASFLASKEMDGTLSWREKMALRLHVGMCDMCRRYLRDLKRLRVMMRRAGIVGQTLLPTTATLSEKARERIKQALNNAAQFHK
ncbi:hypothetical protein MGMO_177c00230 [Methyloglobulus morosus KoM1]|uniref:Putative zinc-finger domain-containing protein n=1 Tax=Methyloglobulus morosus KoM1 TaxID=1116472 RepID=V5BKR9_9GAMM|nr:zf-HC2 domain-containing protein [Methyloglobulus morosus]ESS66732.1 hypothetical protein MGMO_177c00230 [Methyloglobulus morosus KoM1]